MTKIIPATELTLAKVATLLQAAYFACSSKGELQPEWLEIESTTGSTIQLIVTPQAIRLRALACEGYSDDPEGLLRLANYLHHAHPCLKLLVAKDGTGCAAIEIAHAQGLLPVQLIAAVRHLESLINLVRDTAACWKVAESNSLREFAAKIHDSNKAWLYAADGESGDVLLDADGRPVLTEIGKVMFDFVERAEQCGVKHPAVQWEVANAMLQSFLAGRQQEKDTAASQN